MMTVHGRGSGTLARPAGQRSSANERISHEMRYPWLPYLLADLLAIILSYYLAVLFRFQSAVGRVFYDYVTLFLLEVPAGGADDLFELFYYESAFRIILILAMVIGMLYALRHLYAGRRFLLKRADTWDIFLCNLIALSIFYIYWYFTRNTHHPRSFFATLIALNILLTPLFRGLARILLQQAREKLNLDRCDALLVGEGGQAELIHDLLNEMGPHGIYNRSRLPAAGSNSFPAWLDNVRTTLEKGHSRMLIVADPALSVPQIMQVIQLTSEMGIPVKILSSQLDVLISAAHLPCDMLQGIPLVHFNAPPHGGGRLGVVRHGMTVLCASCLLLLAAPLMFLIGCVIRLTSPGPSLFRQKRIGINRKPFCIFKFRTMRHLAEDELATIEAENESGGALFKIRRDPRVTPVGRFLRRFSLDELPQLINVVRGEMAIVGPRPLPERDFLQYEQDWHYIRHNGLPGLTCLWQISGRSNLGFHQMCILDIYYLCNHTWIMDVSIALQTIRIVLFGIGAY